MSAGPGPTKGAGEPPVVVPPGAPAGGLGGDGARVTVPGRPRSRLRFPMAMLVAAAADALSFLGVLPPGYVAVVAIDLVVALLLWGLLGRGWVMLAALAFEAVPGLGLFPFWTLAVLSSEALGAAMETRIRKFRGRGS